MPFCKALGTWVLTQSFFYVVSGAFSKVYKAYDTQTGDYVAVKVVSKPDKSVAEVNYENQLLAVFGKKKKKTCHRLMLYLAFSVTTSFTS